MPVPWSHSVLNDLRARERERVAPPAVPAHQVLGVDALGATDGREVDAEQAGPDDDPLVGLLGVLADRPRVLERPEVVDPVGVRVLDAEAREALRRPARRDQQLVVPVDVPGVRVDLVCVRVDPLDVRVQLQLDVPFLVPLGLVNRDRRLGELPLGELLDENSVVQRLPFVSQNCDVSVRVPLPDRLGGRTPRNPVADDDVRRAHVRELACRA